MKKIFILSFAMIWAFASADNIKIVMQRPKDFVDVKKIIPQIQTDIRYIKRQFVY